MNKDINNGVKRRQSVISLKERKPSYTKIHVSKMSRSMKILGNYKKALVTARQEIVSMQNQNNNYYVLAEANLPLGYKKLVYDKIKR